MCYLAHEQQDTGEGLLTNAEQVCYNFLKYTNLLELLGKSNILQMR